MATHAQPAPLALPAPVRPAGAAALRMLAPEAAFIAAFVFLDWLSYIHQYAAFGITPWDPGKGLALAWLMWRGPSRALSLFAAIALSACMRPSPQTWALLAATSAVVAGLYTLGALLLMRRFSVDAKLERVRDVILLLLVGALTAAAVALSHIGILVAGGMLSHADFAPAALRQWVGDIIGIAVVAPAVLRAPIWFAQRQAARVGRYYLEAAVTAVAIGGVLWTVFGLESSDEYKFFYLLFVPLVAIAVRRGIDGACMAALVTQLGLLLTVQNRGFSAFEVTDFQILLLALTVTALLTGAVVSEREQAERARRESERLLRERQSELEHSARLGALGEMASTLAHELNQPMTASRAYIRTAQRLLAAEGSDALARKRAAESVVNAVAQIDLAASILRNLRDLVRPRAVAAQPTDVVEIVEQSLLLLRAQARAAKAEIRVRHEGGLKPMMAERIRVQQVILNLVRNALDAVKPMPPQRRRVEIATGPTADGEYVEIAVRDRGPGVSAEMVPRLFTAFATTKAEGLGLGLSICHGIAAEHGGRLWLESTGPEGADFRFTLPLKRHTIAG